MRHILNIVQHPTCQSIMAWIYALCATLCSIFLESLRSLVVSIALVVFFMIGDFLTGIFASKRVRKEGIQSSKLRWSVAKYGVYVFFVVGTLVAGICIHAIYCFNKHLEINVHSAILDWTLTFLVAQMIFISWIEVVSVIENLRLVYPKDKFLKGLHYLFLVDFKKMIPMFSNYLKENKSKELDKLNTDEHE